MDDDTYYIIGIIGLVLTIIFVICIYLPYCIIYSIFMGGPPTKEYKEQLARQHLYEKQQAEKSRLKMIEYGKEFARIFKRHH